MSEFSRTPVVALLSAVSANGAGPVIDLGVPQDTLTLEVETSGTVSAFSVQLAASVDGTHFENVGSAITAVTAGTSVGTGALFQYFQATLSGYTGTGTVTCELAYALQASSSGGGGPPGALASDSDVSMSSPAQWQVLAYSGSKWANIVPPAYESVHAIGTTGSTATLDATSGAVQTATLGAATAFSLASVPSTGAWSLTLILSQPATGGPWTATFSGVKWQDGVAPVLTANASAVDILVLATPDGGTAWYGSLAGLNYS